MVESPPLDELAARKRLVQARMELHRAELALYYQEALSPVRKFSAFVSKPSVKWTAIAAVVGLLMTGSRMKIVQKITGKMSPLLMAPLKTFITTRVIGFVMRALQNFQSKQGPIDSIIPE
jgi:hypothetical protein